MAFASFEKPYPSVGIPNQLVSSFARIPVPPRIFHQLLQACKTFGQMGKQRLPGIYFSIFYILPGGEVAISDVDMDSFPGAYPAIPIMNRTNP